MRSTFRILFYINKSKIKADGITAILCRITIDGESVVITTGESTVPHDWSVKRGETKEKKTNQRLQTFREKVEQGYNTLLYKYGAVSAELLKNYLQGVGKTPTTLPIGCLTFLCAVAVSGMSPCRLLRLSSLKIIASI